MRRELTHEDAMRVRKCNLHSNEYYRLVTEFITKYKMSKDRKTVILWAEPYVNTYSKIYIEDNRMKGSTVIVHFGKLDDDGLLFTDCRCARVECIVTEDMSGVTCRRCLGH